MKKELYYIRGNAERADEAKAALLEKYPDAENPNDHSFNCEEVLYYVDPVSNCIATTIKGVGDACGILVYFGTELHLPPKEEPKFKVGDVVKITNTFVDNPLMCITKIEGGSICATDGCVKSVTGHPLANVKRVNDKEFDRWNKDFLHPRHRHYSKSDRKLKHWFLPFDRVLTRDDHESAWQCDFFSNFLKAEDTAGMGDQYLCVGGCYDECVPYNEKTANLLGTKDDYKEEEL